MLDPEGLNLQMQDNTPQKEEEVEEEEEDRQCATKKERIQIEQS